MILDGTMRTKTLSTEAFTRLFLYRRTKDFHVLLELTILAGLSFDDVSGLRWKDIDLEKGVIRVSGGEITIPSSVAKLLKEFRFKKLNEYFDRDMLDRFEYVYCDENGNSFSASELERQFFEYLDEHAMPRLTPEQIHLSYPEELYSKDMVNEVIKQFVTNIRLHPVFQKKWAEESGQI